MVAELLKRPEAEGKKPRLMFQDEARFGRMSRPRRCWAPPGTRPVMKNGYEREFTYVYGAVSPIEARSGPSPVTAVHKVLCLRQLPPRQKIN